MTAEGMVHALKKIHHLLTPTGTLIDMHPTGDPPPITVRLGNEQHLVGWIREAYEDNPYEQADEALTTAVSQNLYQRQTHDTFAFITYFDTLSDLQQYLEAEWTDAHFEDLVAMQIESMMQTPVPDKEIIIKEIVHIITLKPL
jgi:hypothetical protein